MKHSTQHSEETKRKKSEAMKGKRTGEKNPMYGKSPSIETRQKISKAHKGQFAGSKHPFYGKHHTAETKKKMSEALSGKQLSAEHRKKISKILKGRHLSVEHKAKLTGELSHSWKGGKVKMICKTCGKTFHIKPSRLKYGFGEFCSRRCRSIWTIKHQKAKDTAIELAIEQELVRRSIPYLKQAPIEGIALVDFLLPNKIIVQCDGDYWHSREINKGKDIAQDTVLFFKGYKVFRFWEKDIKKSANKCVNKIIGDIYGIINPLKKSA